jgi:hypothetical protein
VFDRETDLFALARLLFKLWGGDTASQLAAPARALLRRVMARDLAGINGPHELVAALDLGQAPPPNTAKVSLKVGARCIVIELEPQPTVELRAGLRPLEEVLSKPGPWSVAYALSGGEWGSSEAAVLVDLHRRYLKNLRQVAFCSSHPLGRGCGVIAGRAIQQLKSKTFAVSATMFEWLGEPAP